MRYKKISKKSYTANIFFSFFFMAVCLVGAYFFVFPYETVLTISTEKLTENELLEMKCDVGCYEEIMKNSNYINGGEMYQVGKNKYISPMEEKRKIYIYESDGLFSIMNFFSGDEIGRFRDVYINLPGTPVLWNGYWVVISDDLLFVGDNAKPYKCKAISFDWKKHVITNGKYDYSRIVEILKTQHTEKVSLANIAVLLGLTQEGVLLNFNGDYAVFAERNKKSDKIDFIKYSVDGTSEKFGPYKYSDKNSVISFAQYACFTTEETFCWLDLSSGETTQKYYEHEGKKSRAIFHGYYENNGKYDYIFGTERATGIVYGEKTALDGKISMISTPQYVVEVDYDEMNAWYLDHFLGKTDICLAMGTSRTYKTIKKGE